MINRIALTSGLAACLILTGCYNDPETSLKKPGAGPVIITAGPAVGPGTTQGGSTAGPQPKATHREPKAGEASHEKGNEAHSSPAEKH